MMVVCLEIAASDSHPFCSELGRVSDLAGLWTSESHPLAGPCRVQAELAGPWPVDEPAGPWPAAGPWPVAEFEMAGPWPVSDFLKSKACPCQTAQGPGRQTSGKELFF